VDEAPRYGDSRLELHEGDMLFAYTDGLIEARREGELFGAERLGSLIGSWDRSEPAEELVRHVHEHVRRWANGLTDDAVALALRRRS
jgi:sigma-B regulation protein RsbU (phosphoserine phosphatase)